MVQLVGECVRGVGLVFVRLYLNGVWWWIGRTQGGSEGSERKRSGTGRRMGKF